MRQLLDSGHLGTAGKFTEYTSKVHVARITGGKLRTSSIVTNTGSTFSRRMASEIDEATSPDDEVSEMTVSEVLNDLRMTGQTVGEQRGSGKPSFHKQDKRMKTAAVEGKSARSGVPGLSKKGMPRPNALNYDAAASVRVRPSSARRPVTGIAGRGTVSSRMQAPRKVSGFISRSLQTAANAISRATAAVSGAIAGATGVPIIFIVAGTITVMAMVAALLSWLPGSAMQHGCDARIEIAIPAAAEEWVAKAAETSGLDVNFIAAMMTIESGFAPDAYADDINGGTWGLLQINRSVWSSVHPQGADATPPEGITDPMTHAEYGGIYLARRLETVRNLKMAHPNAQFSTLDDLDALVIAHNAGEGNLMAWPDIPEITRTYLDKMHEMTGSGADASCSVTGLVIGTLDPPLIMNGDNTAANLDAMNLQEATTYARWECTWWAASRRMQINKPVNPYMGDGHMWRDSAAKYGYPTGKSPHPGDVMVFQKGILGSSRVYGHVAIVEEVKDDGSVVISESNSTAARVTLRTITVQQIDSNIESIDFIH